ncbi:type II secretion system protein N [Photobacterium leiognathi]|uniref:type II secretion system protein N n=1 Tax=Photobacterium leiognathi TaxID=553611 RepID=UPI0027344138|nr:type II secretion system protein N [Photobacterium leiognathi]
MKFKLAIGTTFGLVFIASAIAHVPANWAWQQAPKVSGLSLTGIKGTLWQGSASRLVWQNQNLGQVSWDMSVGSLFTGKAAFDVRFGQGSDMQLQGSGTVGYSMAGPFAKKLLVSVPAANAMQYAKVPVPLTLTGNLELTVRDYVYTAPYCKTLNATLAWAEGSASSPMGNINPGPVFADLNCQEGAIAAKAAQSSEDVSSDWQASLAKNNSYSLSGWFKPGANFPEQLSQQLKWLGEPDSKGQYKINYSGRL